MIDDDLERLAENVYGSIPHTNQKSAVRARGQSKGGRQMLRCMGSNIPLWKRQLRVTKAWQRRKAK